jgi:hydrogenase maturation protease
VKNKLILCIGYPFLCDRGLGYHVSKILQERELPDDVDLMEVGESVSEFDYAIDGREKMVVVDSFQTGDPPGTVVRLNVEDTPMTVDGVTDLGKYHLIDTLDQIKLSGRCPETVCIGVVPKDIKTDTPQPRLTPEIEAKVPEVVDRILKEVSK